MEKPYLRLRASGCDPNHTNGRFVFLGRSLTRESTFMSASNGGSGIDEEHFPQFGAAQRLHAVGDVLKFCGAAPSPAQGVWNRGASSGYRSLSNRLFCDSKQAPGVCALHSMDYGRLS